MEEAESQYNAPYIEVQASLFWSSFEYLEEICNKNEKTVDKTIEDLIHYYYCREMIEQYD